MGDRYGGGADFLNKMYTFLKNDYDRLKETEKTAVSADEDEVDIGTQEEEDIESKSKKNDCVTFPPSFPYNNIQKDESLVYCYGARIDGLLSASNGDSSDSSSDEDEGNQDTLY